MRQFILLSILFCGIYTCTIQFEPPTVVLKDINSYTEEVQIKSWLISGKPFRIDTLVFNNFVDTYIDSSQTSNFNEAIISQSIELQQIYLKSANDSAWQKIQTKDRCMILNSLYDPEPLAIYKYVDYCYATCLVNSKSEQDVAILGSCDDAMKIWVNGKVVYKAKEHFDMYRNSAISSAHLQRGLNVIWVKICNIERNWGFYVSLASIESVKEKYLNNRHGNFLDRIEYQPGELMDIGLNKAFFKEDSNVKVRIENPAFINVHESTLGFTKDSLQFRLPESLTEGAYFLTLRFKEDSISQYFTVGKAFTIARTYIEALQMHTAGKPFDANIDTYVRRFNRLMKNTRTRIDHYLYRKFALFSFELGNLLYLQQSKLEPYRHVPGLHLRNYVSEIDGSTQTYQIFIPSNYSKNKPIPLVIEIPYLISKTRPFYEGMHVADLKRITFLTRIAEKYGLAYLWPNSRTNVDFNLFPIASKATFEAIESVKDAYTIDSTRLYLMGNCWGGANTLSTAIRYPYSFASIGIEAPDLSDFDSIISKKPQVWRKNNDPVDFLGNLRNLPLFITHSKLDMKADYNKTLNIITQMKDKKQRFQFISYEDLPKNKFLSMYDEQEFLNEAFTFFRNHQNNFSPDTIDFSTRENKYNRAAWISIKQIEPGQKATIKAIVCGNSITVQQENILAYSIRLGQIAQLTQSDQVSIWENGQMIYEGAIIPEFEAGNHDYLNQKNYLVEGPVHQVFGNSFIVVQGTTGTQREREMADSCVARMNKKWQNEFFGSCRIRKDYEINDSDIKNNHLVLIGSAKTNSIIKRIAEKLPFSVAIQEVKYDQESIIDENTVVSYIYPNPLNIKKLVLVVSGNSKFKWSAIPIDFWYSGYYDYNIYKLSSDSSSNVVRQGYFDKNWRIKNAK
jgi:hypothetical protein